MDPSFQQKVARIKRVILRFFTLLLMLFALPASAYNSMLEYENNAQEKMNFGYMSTLNDCFSTGKLMYLNELTDLRNVYIPKIQEPDEIMPKIDTTVYNVAAAAVAGRTLTYAALGNSVPIGTVIAFLMLASEYISMIDVCTNAYIVQPHEFVNRDILGLKCEKDPISKTYYFDTKKVLGSPDPIKPFTAEEIPYYYTCDPRFNIEDPGTLITDPDLVGRNYGYVDYNSDYCTDKRLEVANNINFQNKIGGIMFEFVPGIEKFFSWTNGNYGEPCNARLKKGPKLLFVDGKTARMPGYELYDWFAHYKFDAKKSKIRICVTAPYTMIPVKVGCSYVPHPVPVSPVDPFISQYLQDTTCSYFMNGRSDLESLGEALNVSDESGNNKEFVRRFLKSEFHLTSTVTSCVKEMLYRVFIDEDPSNDYKSFFITVRDSLRAIVFAVLALYVAISGIGLMIDQELQKSRGKIVMLVVKFALVFYFSVGDSWYYRDSKGQLTGFLPMLLEAPSELTAIIFNAYNQNDPIGYCKYRLGGKELFDERVVEPGDVPDPIVPTHGSTGVKMNVFDLIDCKLANYLNFGTCRYDAGGIVIMWLSALCFWSGPMGILLCIVSLIYLFLLLLIIFKLVHVFILSLFILVILIFFAPIFVLFALFKATYNIFETWLKMLIGYAIYPAFSFVFVAFMLASLDLVYYGSLDKNIIEAGQGGGGTRDLQAACQAATEPSAFCITVNRMGYDDPCYKPGALIDNKFYDEKNLGLFKVRALKRDIAEDYLAALGKLLLFAFLFFLLLNSMVEFVAIILGVWGFWNNSLGAMNLLNPLKAIFGGK